MVVGGAPSTNDDLPSERREVRERASERHGHAEEWSANGLAGGGGGGPPRDWLTEDILETAMLRNAIQ
jgi:hypothetical protein